VAVVVLEEPAKCGERLVGGNPQLPHHRHRGKKALEKLGLAAGEEFLGRHSPYDRGKPGRCSITPSRSMKPYALLTVMGFTPRVRRGAGGRSSSPGFMSPLVTWNLI
jgi:hypothetical protein